MAEEEKTVRPNWSEKEKEKKIVPLEGCNKRKCTLKSKCDPQITENRKQNKKKKWGRKLQRKLRIKKSGEEVVHEVQKKINN